MELKNKNMNIEFSSALIDVVEKNPSFDMGKLRIAYTGKNRNNTFISKNAFERAIPTMFNCPVVANYMRKEDEIGSHDGEFIKDKDGDTKYVNITQPVGLVPESAHWSWETVEDNGVVHQYLCTEVVLWKRQEAYEKIKENGVTKQSMEIEVMSGEMLDDYYDIREFCFTAFCLLGTAEPCFESAALFTFAEQDSFKKQYTEMLKEFKLAFASASDNTVKEVSEDLKLKELLEKYSITEEELTFEIEGLSDEELEAKFAEEFEEKKPIKDDPDADSDDEIEEDEPVVEPEPEPEVGPTSVDEPATGDEPDVDPVSDEPTADEGGAGDEGGEGGDDSYALNSQTYETLCDAVRSAEMIDAEWGSYPRYFMIDFDEDSKEVYFYDVEDYLLYGCSYSYDNDDITIDFACKKRKKYAIVDYIEGEISQEFSLSELINTFNEKFNEVKVDAKEFERLKNFEADVLTAKRESEETALFEKFEEKLNGNEEFEALKEKASEYDLDTLEKELFALVGKVDFSLSLKEMGAKNNQEKAKPMFGFEALFASNDDKSVAGDADMDAFMKKYAK